MRKPLVRPFPRHWYVRSRAYRLFMARELTALFIGAYLIFLLVLLNKLGAGEDVFVAFLKVLRHPLSLILHVLVLVAALWHSITWFNLTPTVMPLFLGEKRVAGPMIAVGLGYLPWIVVTILIIWGVCA
ncbi:MAG: hypothetical protein V3U29_05100 [Phycisphaeraceae bacterium]